MRTLGVLLLALLGAGILAFVLTRPAPTPEAPPPESRPIRADPPPLGDEVPPETRWATLVVKARAVDGSVPPGTRVGYERDGRRTLEAVDERGKRMFTNVAPGPVLVIATAPGYLEAQQERPLVGGMPTTVTLKLRRDD